MQYQNEERRLAFLLCCALFVPIVGSAQLTTGTLSGIVRANGYAAVGLPIVINGDTGFEQSITTDSQGRFDLVLPYGQYQIATHGSRAVPVFVPALATTELDLNLDGNGGLWIDTTRTRVFAEPFSLNGILLSREPGSVTQPLNYTGVHDNRLPIVSQRGMSWTYTQFK